ncbi:hypothetical protein AB0S60_17940 [Escherichia coli]
MTEPTNKDSEIKKHLLEFLDSQSENIAKHFYSHIKDLIEAGELSEAHNNLALIEKYITRPPMDEEPNINENKANKRKNVKSLEPNNYVEHIIQLEERNSILTLQLEHYTQDLNRKNAIIENNVKQINSLISENKELRSQVQQQRIDDKIPTYVNDVKSDLGSDDKHFILMSIIWSIAGVFFGFLAVVSAFFTLYMDLDLKNLTNLQLIYIFTRGLVGIAILSWLSYICLSNSKKYTHESIRRKDRRHALMFGQVFLQIYGSTATKEDAIEVFKDWNISGDSAFSGQTEQPPSFASFLNTIKDKVKVTGSDKETD